MFSEISFFILFSSSNSSPVFFLGTEAANFALEAESCFCNEAEGLELVFPFIVAWIFSDISFFSSVFLLGSEVADFALEAESCFWVEVEGLELVPLFIVAWVFSDISFFLFFSSSESSSVFVSDEDGDFAVDDGTCLWVEVEESEDFENFEDVEVLTDTYLETLDPDVEGKFLLRGRWYPRTVRMSYLKPMDH